MAIEVIWTPNAERDYDAILSYLLNEWSLKIAKEFAIECLMKIELLSHSPQIGTVSSADPRIRKFLMTKHNYLFYKFDKDKVTLLNFIDTRKEPLSNPY